MMYMNKINIVGHCLTYVVVWVVVYSKCFCIFYYKYQWNLNTRIFNATKPIKIFGDYIIQVI